MNMNTNGISLNKKTTVSEFLKVNGITNINNGGPYSTENKFMQSGSLTIGGINANYRGGSSWSSNTAGLLLECLDNTEIPVHDASNRVASSIYFQGVGIHKITIGRNMGWDHRPQRVRAGPTGIWLARSFRETACHTVL